MNSENNFGIQTESDIVRLAKDWLKGTFRVKEQALYTLTNHPAALTKVREVATYRSAQLRDYATDRQSEYPECSAEEYNLIEKLSDHNWTNRCTAARLLASYKSQSGKRALFARFLLENHAAVRRDIANALGSWNDKQVVEFLRRALATEIDPTARIGCLAGLARSGQDDCLTELLLLMDHKDAVVRRQVVNAVAQNAIQLRKKTFVFRKLNDVLNKEENAGVRESILLVMNHMN